jgi:hypothetical protein
MVRRTSADAVETAHSKAATLRIVVFMVLISVYAQAGYLLRK